MRGAAPACTAMLLATSRWSRTKILTTLEHSQTSTSAGDSGYRRIRSDIIFGVLTPSGRLKLDSMKEDYGVSVSTLREILNLKEKETDRVVANLKTVLERSRENMV